MQLLHAYITRIEQINPLLNLVVIKNFEQALALAHDVDAALDANLISDEVGWDGFLLFKKNHSQSESLKPGIFLLPAFQKNKINTDRELPHTTVYPSIYLTYIKF